MGFFSNMLGSKPDYPDLTADHPIAPQIEQIMEPLQSLLEKVKDPIEIVPAASHTYVFIGKPPKKFGIAWIKGGKLSNFQAVAKEQGIGAAQMVDISEKLGSAYEEHSDAKRYSANIADRNVVVTPSSELTREMDKIIGEVIH
jgi:hypothetical protein